MKPDIVQIAKEDPVVAGLLEFKSLFYWADWQLIRQNGAPELVDKILTRVRASIYIPFLIASTQIPLLARPNRYPIDSTFWEVWGFSIAVGTVMIVGLIAFQLVTRKQLRRQVMKLQRLKIMARNR